MEKSGASLAEYEEINQRRKARSAESRPAQGTTATTTAYSRDKCCWRCKQRGHTRLDCKRPPKKFCSRCGKDGVLTRDCHPPGNERRAGDVAAVTEPVTQ